MNTHITRRLVVPALVLSALAASGLTHEELQWQGFGDRIIEFSGYRWRAKEGGIFGPGRNYFSGSGDNIRVDEKGRLHLRITQRDGKWYCPELALVDALGYGDYIFKTVGRVDRLDPNVILGLFLWEYQESYPSNDVYNGANEFDIEFGRWKNPQREPVQFACQPWQKSGNEHRYNLQLDSDDALSSHALLWHPSGMACRSWRGHNERPAPSDMIENWFYAGEDLPRLEAPRVHINFWCIEEPPSDLKEHEIVIAGFTFVPCASLVPPAPAPVPAETPRAWWEFWRAD
ncbi:MAG: hypothetical protein V1873_05620 [Verrucomicrobiota bacterium]